MPECFDPFMLPCQQRSGQPRSASGAGIGTDCDRDTVTYDILDADAQTATAQDLPGAACMVALGCKGSSQTPIHFQQHRQAGSQRSTTQRAVWGMRKSRHDAADTPPPGSPASVMMWSTQPHQQPQIAKPRPQQKTRQASDSQKPDALASAGERQTEQKQTRTRHTVDAPQQTAQPDAAA